MSNQFATHDLKKTTFEVLCGKRLGNTGCQVDLYPCCQGLQTTFCELNVFHIILIRFPLLEENDIKIRNNVSYSHKLIMLLLESIFSWITLSINCDIIITRDIFHNVFIALRLIIDREFQTFIIRSVISYWFRFL